MYIYMEEVNNREKYIIWRKRNKITLAMIADYCKCSGAAISYFETGKRDLVPLLLERYNEFIRRFDNGEIELPKKK